MNTLLPGLLILFSIALSSCSHLPLGGDRWAGDVYRGEAEGRCLVQDGPEEEARRKAVTDALRKILRKAESADGGKGEGIPEDVRVHPGYLMVRDWKLLKGESRRVNTPRGSATEYLARVSAEVIPLTVHLQKESGVDLKTGPRIYILVLEEPGKGKPGKPGFSFTELALTEELLSIGFPVMEPLACAGSLMKNNREAMRDLRVDLIRTRLGALCKPVPGGVLILGSTGIRDLSPVMASYASNMHSVSAVVRLKAVDMTTGRILAAAIVNAPGAHIDSAAASKIAVTRCIKKMIGGADPYEKSFYPGSFLKLLLKGYRKE